MLGFLLMPGLEPPDLSDLPLVCQTHGFSRGHSVSALWPRSRGGGPADELRSRSGGRDFAKGLKQQAHRMVVC